jgi:hypothetical protein
VIIPDQDGKPDIGRVKLGNIILNILNKSNKMSDLLYEVEITKSKTALDNVCSTKKICDSQGPITFGQLRDLVESGKIKRIGVHMGEGAYKAMLRLVPWFIPQLVLAGFAATWIRVANKLLRPTLEETTNYKTWWGKTILNIFKLVEGELNASDPLSKIFFISDGLMTMLSDKYKVEFARYIAELADEQPNDEIVPEYFVENELRNWLNEKFFLDPPLQPKKNKNDDVSLENISETIMSIKKGILLEGQKYDSLIRQIVRDIVKIYKSEDDGEFYLPEDVSDEYYEYSLGDVSVDVELILETSSDVDDFMVNADYYHDDDVVVVKIVYNPENKIRSIYNLVGELNEIISHELRHNYQRNTGMFDLVGDDDELTGFEYYTQPHELDAQYHGFKRMSKITRKPFEMVVVDWFEKNKDIHQMSDEESKSVIEKILSFRP